MARGAQQRVKQAAERSKERALKEERLGLAAIAKVFVMEANDPGRLLARLEAMARSAEANVKVPLATRRALLDGTILVRTAIEREIGKPQTLMDPDVGHTSPAKVDKLVGSSEGTMSEQLGLTTNGDGVGGAEEIHAERVKTLRAVHEGLVVALRQGAATDDELHRRYLQLKGVPSQSRGGLIERRKELTASGRVCSSGSKHKGETMWCLVESLT